MKTLRDLTPDRGQGGIGNMATGIAIYADRRVPGCDPKTGIGVFGPLGSNGCLPKSPERVARETESVQLSKRYEALSIQEMTLDSQLNQLCKAQGGNYYDYGTWRNQGAPSPTRPRCTVTYPMSTGRKPDFKWGLDAGIAPFPQAQALLDQVTAIKAEMNQNLKRQNELRQPYEGGPCEPPAPPVDPNSLFASILTSVGGGIRIGDSPYTIQEGKCVSNVELLRQREQRVAVFADAKPFIEPATWQPPKHCPHPCSCPPGAQCAMCQMPPPECFPPRRPQAKPAAGLNPVVLAAGAVATVAAVGLVWWLRR